MFAFSAPPPPPPEKPPGSMGKCPKCHGNMWAVEYRAKSNEVFAKCTYCKFGHVYPAKDTAP